VIPEHCPTRVNHPFRTYNPTMIGIARTLSVASLAAATAAIVVVATAPNTYPTPIDSLSGHQLLPTQQAIDLALVLASALFAGLATTLSLTRFRFAAATLAVTTSALAVNGMSVLAWRLHAPVSAGNL
jgi:hypothetical protein